MIQPKTFAFIAHYVETWNWLLNHRIFNFLHDRPELRVFLWPLYPLCWAMSLFYMVRRKPFQVVDVYSVSGELRGYTILINNFGWHFLFPWYYGRIRRRILEATLYAQNELHVDVVGLGALTKAETVTQGGLWLKSQPGINVPVVHGDTCTAWSVIKQLEELSCSCGQNKTIVLIGPTSKIGRAVILDLVRRGFLVMALTQARERFLALQAELPTHLQKNLVQITDLREAQNCKIWVTGKSSPAGRNLLTLVPLGATIVNFAVPDPLDLTDLKKRPDITHISGGLVATPPGCEMHFTMRLARGVTYACTAGTMIHALRGWKEDELSDVDMGHLQKVARDCEALGFQLPYKNETKHKNSA